jgi:AcrR family transcriptional regulator
MDEEDVPALLAWGLTSETIWLWSVAVATSNSSTQMIGRASARRLATVEEALDHATELLKSEGVGAVTVSEVARRMGLRAPSLYKYFPSRNAIYDAVFARGNREINAAVDAAVETVRPGLDRMLAASRAVLRWSFANPGMAQLMFWRPVPGFEPSAASFEPSMAMWLRFRVDLTIAAQQGELDESADSEDVLRLLTIVIAGITSQQMSNQPDVGYDDGAFTSLTEQALAMFVHEHSITKTQPRSRKART